MKKRIIIIGASIIGLIAIFCVVYFAIIVPQGIGAVEPEWKSDGSVNTVHGKILEILQENDEEIEVGIGFGKSAWLKSYDNGYFVLVIPKDIIPENTTLKVGNIIDFDCVRVEDITHKALSISKK